MSAAFDKALAFTLGPGIEGGASNRVSDRGGATNRGVTQAEYESWRSRHGLGPQSVYMMADDELRALYYEDYWVPCRCEEMPPALGAAVFDMSVNSGAYNARITLQEALAVKVDGQIGDVTLLAAHNAPDAILKFLEARAGFYRDDLVAHARDIANLHGWINRLLRFQDAAYKGAFA